MERRWIKRCTDWVRPIEPHKSSVFDSLCGRERERERERERGIEEDRNGAQRRRKKARAYDCVLRFRKARSLPWDLSNYRLSFQRLTLPFIGPDKESLGLRLPMAVGSFLWWLWHLSAKDIWKLRGWSNFTVFRVFLCLLSLSLSLSLSRFVLRFAIKLKGNEESS